MKMILEKGAMAQLVQHSDIFRARFARHLRNIEGNPIYKARIKSLSAAKHRFDTWQKPFGRLCLSYEAALTTAQEIHEERRSTAVGRQAKEFLILATDEEASLCLAMMSDAGDESIQLVRMLDDEQFDKKELGQACGLSHPRET